MNKQQYKEYLNSEHWKKFRKETYSKRKRCQKCSSKKKLNIHHITYVNIWKETQDDVLVLCNECHFRGHKKPQFIKKMREGKELDFVKKARNTKRLLYNASGIFRDCDRCGKQHSVFYKKYVTGKLMLAMACPNSKPRTSYIKFEEGLDIPIIANNKKAKLS